MKTFIAILILSFAISCSTMPEPEKNHAQLQKTQKQEVEIDPYDVMLGIMCGIIYSPF
jgi:hypothetical protein